jgi:hypothetical protein
MANVANLLIIIEDLTRSNCALLEKLKTADPTSRQRGRPTSTNPQLSKNNRREKEKIGRGSQMGA